VFSLLFDQLSGGMMFLPVAMVTTKFKLYGFCDISSAMNNGAILQ
jgi:hypothetical protein